MVTLVTDLLNAEVNLACLLYVSKGNIDEVILACLKVKHHIIIRESSINMLVSVPRCLGFKSVNSKDPSLGFQYIAFLGRIGSISSNQISTGLRRSKLSIKSSGHNNSVINELVGEICCTLFAEYNVISRERSKTLDRILKLLTVCAISIVVATESEPVILILNTEVL